MLSDQLLGKIIIKITFFHLKTSVSAYWLLTCILKNGIITLKVIEDYYVLTIYYYIA